MNAIRRSALLLAVAAACICTTRAQQTGPGRPEVGGFYDEEKYVVELGDANWRIGLGIGPSIGTEAELVNDIRAQGRLYVRRQFNRLLQAEVGVGLHRMAGNYGEPGEFDTHLWSIDGRGMIAPALDDQWNPYGSLGIGYARYRIIDPVDQSLASEGDFAVREDGGGWIVPFGIGVGFKPARHSRFAIDVGIGYTLILSEEFDGGTGGGNLSTVSGLVALEYLFHDVLEDHPVERRQPVSAK